jgi:hypothetical protein
MTEKKELIDKLITRQTAFIESLPQEKFEVILRRLSDLSLLTSDDEGNDESDENEKNEEEEAEDGVKDDDTFFSTNSAYKPTGGRLLRESIAHSEVGWNVDGRLVKLVFSQWTPLIKASKQTGWTERTKGQPGYRLMPISYGDMQSGLYELAFFADNRYICFYGGGSKRVGRRLGKEYAAFGDTQRYVIAAGIKRGFDVFYRTIAIAHIPGTRIGQKIKELESKLLQAIDYAANCSQQGRIEARPLVIG